MNKFCFLILLIGVVSFFNMSLFAKVDMPEKERALKIANLFSDSVVLQYNEPIRVWGWGAIGAEVRIRFDEHDYATIVDSKGCWDLVLKSCISLNPQELIVRSGEDRILIKDVLMGEVWLASGQSNMAYPVSKSDVNDHLPEMSYDKIRFFKSIEIMSEFPEDEIFGIWQKSNKKNRQKFSAVAFSYAVALHKKLGRPIGIIQSARGGSRCEAWVPKDQLDLDHKFYSYPMKFVRNFETRNSELIENYYRTVSDWKSSGRIWPTPKYSEKQLGGYIIRKPYGLYNGMIHPLYRFRIKGALWYQGEGNSGESEAYSHLFPKMIGLWRKNWGYDFPFYFVQLPAFIRNDLKVQKDANFNKKDHYQENLNIRHKWASFREAQAKTLRIKDTGMVVTLDTGEPFDVHPSEKFVIGHRLAQSSMHSTYGLDVVGRGPYFLGKLSFDAGNIRVPLGSSEGLKTQDGLPPKGFSIAGEDQVFYWVDKIVIDKNALIMSSSKVPRPIAVRYAWLEFPEVNLFNGANLPMEPFRTDNWEIR